MLVDEFQQLTEQIVEQMCEEVNKEVIHDENEDI